MDTALPFGMRKIMLTPYTDAAGTVLASESIRLPNARTLSFSDTEDFTELRGDDRKVAEHGNGSAVEWELESGGLPFEAFKAMSGGTLVESGVEGDRTLVYSKKVTDQRPYFRIEGQAISDSGGDVHTVIYRAKATGELSGEFADGEFFLTSASGVGIAVASGPNADKLYDFIYNEQIKEFVEPATGTNLPAITSVTPEGQGTGETILIMGVNLASTSAVTVDGSPATNLVVHGTTAVSVDLPAGTAGVVPVVVTNTIGNSTPFNYTRG